MCLDGCDHCTCISIEHHDFATHQFDDLAKGVLIHNKSPGKLHCFTACEMSRTDELSNIWRVHICKCHVEGLIIAGLYYDIADDDRGCLHNSASCQLYTNYINPCNNGCDRILSMLHTEDCK